jgi:hypothetical protein
MQCRAGFDVFGNAPVRWQKATLAPKLLAALTMPFCTFQNREQHGDKTFCTK